MMRRIILIIVFIQFGLSFSNAQTNFYPNDVNQPKNKKTAWVGATIFVDWQTRIPNATLLVEDGVITGVGTNIQIPEGTTIINVNGYCIYPSFIDLFSNYGMPPLPDKKGNGNQFNTSKPGPYNQNEAIKPETNASGLFHCNDKDASELRKYGFGLVVTQNYDGISRGSGALVSLGNGRDNELVLNSTASNNFSFDKGCSTQDYPGSLMGCIALMRQTFYDEKWYKETKDHALDLSLDALIKLESTPKLFDAGSVYQILRASEIAKEFNFTFIAKGGGDEYQCLDALKKSGSKLVLPLNFPEPLDVQDSFSGRRIPMSTLWHWEAAPNNPLRVWQAGIEFALTSSGTDKADWWKNLNKVYLSGVPSPIILKSLTETPAKWLGLDSKYGSLKKGNMGNFIICTDSLFSLGFAIKEECIGGVSYVTEGKGPMLNSLDGIYSTNNIYGKIKTINAITVNSNNPTELLIQGNHVDLFQENKWQKCEDINFKDGLLTCEIIGKPNTTFTFKIDTSAENEAIQIQLVSSVNKENLLIPYAKIRDLTKFEGYPDEPVKIIPVAPKKYPFPLSEFGDTLIKNQESVVFKNATVWTAEAEGIISNCDVVISNGKIIAVGKDAGKLYAGFKQIDASQFNITPGIIDEHSHIAISGDVNEGTQSVTSEVRIGDVINPLDVNIYRQLSGGVTSSHLLHGSANCIGGQTQLIKLRWGKTAEELKFANWPGFIKFALGENVKQSNWGDRNNIRYPQTRMGVEQTILDAFLRAKFYQKQWDLYTSKKITIAPRKDLELDALCEILMDKRHITCHSYVQSEINMLMHLADSTGFKVNTFTHILEGYKVADKMKKHGAAGSTFSDWWAYKLEVMEAIPYNAFIMNKMGIITSVNSDDAEMGRRLNQESSKSMKYGGMSKTDAIKLCTINPAIMLHIDKQTGSIKVGKDADIVLWYGSPLSIYGKVQQTYVDGICYYDLNNMEQKLIWVNQERMRILKNMAIAISMGSKSKKPEIEEDDEYHCEH